MTTPSELRIEPLGDHRDLVALTCEWHLPEFDPLGDMDFWLRARREEARQGGVPCAWVDFVGDEPVGSVSLIGSNMDTRKDLSPWLAALYVIPECRGRGIGTALVSRCEHEAVLVGVDHLYLYTARAVEFYRRLGWVVESDALYEGEAVTIMSKELI